MSTYKKIISIIVCFTIGIFCLACANNTEKQPLLRLHIRANSNSDADQSIKLKVRDKIVEYLESELREIDDFEQAKIEIGKRLGRIESIAKEVLSAHGFSYGARAQLRNEFFPTRMYDELVVESGYYDAVIVELGEAEGDNWWCVLYPPLCYLEVSEGSGFRYKSKIKELIDKYFG